MAQHSLHDLLQWHSIPYTTYYNGTALLTRLITMAQHSLHDLPWHSIPFMTYHGTASVGVNTTYYAYTASMGVKMPIYAGTASVGVNTPVYYAYTASVRVNMHAYLRLHSIGGSGKHGTAWGCFPRISVRYKYTRILYSNTYKDQ